MPSPSRTSRLAALSALLIASSVLGACARRDAAEDTTRTVPSADTAASAAAAGGAPAAGAPDDAQIAHIAVTANAIDSAAGELAKQKGSAKAVKDFAQRMVTDHGAVNRQAVALATRLNVTPEDNDVSRGLNAAADSSNANLRGLSGAAFDRAYVDHEVAYHQAVLDVLDRTLIPNARNAELKTLLEQVRPAIASHLDQAKQLQSTLGR